jgi:hypothetical protein
MRERPIEHIAELVPWRELELPRAPWADADCFNPSILRVPDDANDVHAGTWLCNIRATSYPAACPDARHWPKNPRFRDREAGLSPTDFGRSYCSHTRNWIWTLDPRHGWRATDGKEVAWRSGLGPECAYNYVGYEDLRLAWSPSEGLVASGTTLAHNHDGAFEIVVLDLDDDCQIDRATPVRGWWSRECQKNWSPFLGLPVARWLYSPIGGGVVDRAGGGMPAARAFSPELCGGTQLVPVSGDRISALFSGGVAQPGEAASCETFLGLGHGYDPLPDGGRRYWHRAFVVATDGEMVAGSPRFKLSEHDIDFACGLAVDPRESDRAVVTYGVGNTASRLAETSLSALLGLCGPSA